MAKFEALIDENEPVETAPVVRYASVERNEAVERAALWNDDVELKSIDILPKSARAGVTDSNR